MEAIYVINARLGGGGIGNTAYYAVLGPQRAGCLKRVICSSNRQVVIPPQQLRTLGLVGRAMKRVAFLDKSGRLNDWANVVFDNWSSLVLESCDVLHCWSDLGHTLRRGKGLATTTVVEAMIHPIALRDILLREAARWGTRTSDLPSAQRLARALSEIESADVITVPSEFDRKTHVACGVPEHKLRVVPYGVDTQRFHPSPQRPTSDPFRAAFVGNFSLRKGAPYILDAWHKLNWRGAELWIVGHVDGDVHRLIQRYWPQLQGVVYRGFQPNPTAVYHQVDVLLFPSLGEGSALVTYEAMASGLPVIVTENAGALVRPDIDGKVIAPADSDAIAHALESMRADPSRRRDMGKNARAHIEPYTWQSYGDRLLHVYRSLL